jgi:hypothetical protein
MREQIGIEKSRLTNGEIYFIQIPYEEIELMLHWYKPEFFQLKEAYYHNEYLVAKVKFSEYPFIRGNMPFVSSNLINLAIDQCALVHIGMMIKYNFIKLLIKENDILKYMSFEEYNRIVGDEFVTAKIEAQYLKPISPLKEIQVISHFNNLKRNIKGRYLFRFSLKCEEYFNIQAIFAYPLNLDLIDNIE